MKIQKCNIDERNKIDLLIPKLHAAKPGEQAEREPTFDLEEEGRICCSFGFFDFVGCVIFGAVEIWM